MFFSSDIPTHIPRTSLCRFKMQIHTPINLDGTYPQVRMRCVCKRARERLWMVGLSVASFIRYAFKSYIIHHRQRILTAIFYVKLSSSNIVDLMDSFDWQQNIQSVLRNLIHLYHFNINYLLQEYFQQFIRE